MATNIPLTGNFQVTCEYKRKGNWACGWHTGIDLVCDNHIIYGTCNGKVVRTGYDKSYGNFVVVQAPDGRFHWFCHLSSITCRVGQEISRTTHLGVMGNTGNSTGTHLHYEIRNASNKYADNSNPASYMGIPNKVGNYRTSNYQISSNAEPSTPTTPVLKTLARNTNLRSQPNTSASAVLYLANTTLYVIQASVAKANGYTWDKVCIRTNGKEGYMINCNYK